MHRALLASMPTDFHLRTRGDWLDGARAAVVSRDPSPDPRAKSSTVPGDRYATRVAPVLRPWPEGQGHSTGGHVARSRRWSAEQVGQ